MPKIFQFTEPETNKHKEQGYMNNQLENVALGHTTRSLLTLLHFVLLCSLSVLHWLGSFWLGRLRFRSFRLLAMQSSEVDLGNVLVEGLALDLSQFQLQRGRLTRAIGTLRRQMLAELVTRHDAELTANVPAPHGLPPWTSLKLVS